MNEKHAKKLRRAARPTRPTVYLDTSSLRRAGRNLLKLNEKNKAKTSLESIYELLNGIRNDQDSFFRRRGTLRNIIDAKVHIDWRLPEAITLFSFNLTRCFEPELQALFLDQMELKIKQIIDAALSAEDLVQFMKITKDRNLCDALDKIESYDNNSSSHWVKTFTEAFKDNKKILDEINAGLRPKDPDMPYSNLKEFGTWMLKEDKLNINRFMSLHAMAERAILIVRKFCISSYAVSWKDILASYNKTIDCYIEALGFWHIYNYSNMHAPGRNDGTDVAHFLYVDRGLKFITEDSAQANIAKSIKMNTMSVDEYLKSN